ncbi:hypothetical protein Pcinc_000355 [Petrolisthes cinctipes]|uniref:Uncharacterized protein n=1 Tax=Petrolisthes cinctipes TaxID=88211 RepID=A0AAE1G616_PETCI|nr:hypothetical protein Pcinc_008760 [Petrolisthes cinctipes]KAK3895971.1 hypothetical protein Pcinc_000355 [Petrolisthes cinctipes]
MSEEHEETRSLRSVVVAVVRKVFLLLITPEVRRKSCIVFFLWGASSMIYFCGEVLVWGPSAVFSLASLAAAFIVTLLPETKNKIMAQGIDDQPEHVMEQHDPPRPQAAIISAMDLHEVFDFKENGFDNVIEKVTEDSVTIRTNIRTRDDFKKWNEVYMAKTHSRFNSKRLRSVGERKLFREVLICHHGVKHKGVKKTYTG